ncbi:helix-turn-helix domain-containing protein [Lactobacillus sp. PV034]|uniref:helix-turn-helix domain-containing protein n=1 Tax=Lactobacillus sp. PV034 TaxID=2594495 RepID=UPI00223ED945|nr:helix-turn-helix domain-containing protein [Lactobacillus sp. PV034]QNQ80732.1 helix-turn-helix domain-containing protein [Lactobacillus sp. PV034]
MSDIGDKLRKAREEKGMSLKDIEKITKIQYRYLEALENNDFDQLPGDFYARAFIKQYAQVVGLNGNELLNDLHADVPESKPEEYVENSIDNKREEVRRTTNNKKGLWRAYLPKAAAIIGIFLVIFVVYLLYSHFFTGTANQQSANQANNVTVSSSSESPKKSKKTPKKSTSTSKIRLESLGNNTYRVRDWSKARNRDLKLATGATSTYAQVMVNGSVVWQGTLRSNDSHTIRLAKDVQNVSVLFSNTQSTKLTLDGKRVKAQDETNPAASMTINFIFRTADTSQNSANTQTNSSYNQYSSSNNTTSNSNVSQNSQTTQSSSNQNSASTRESQTRQPVQSQQTQPSSSTTEQASQSNQSSGQTQTNAGGKTNQ